MLFHRSNLFLGCLGRMSGDGRSIDSAGGLVTCLRKLRLMWLEVRADDVFVIQLLRFVLIF